jgi:RNA-directed DNA polymerase
MGFKRSGSKIQDVIRAVRHLPINGQADKINQILRGHYNYYGMTGNL